MYICYVQIHVVHALALELDSLVCYEQNKISVWKYTPLNTQTSN